VALSRQNKQLQKHFLTCQIRANDPVGDKKIAYIVGNIRQLPYKKRICYFFSGQNRFVQIIV